VIATSACFLATDRLAYRLFIAGHFTNVHKTLFQTGAFS